MVYIYVVTYSICTFKFWNLELWNANLSNDMTILPYIDAQILELGTVWNANLSNGLYMLYPTIYAYWEFWNLELLERKFK